MTLLVALCGKPEVNVKNVVDKMVRELNFVPVEYVSYTDLLFRDGKTTVGAFTLEQMNKLFALDDSRMYAIYLEDGYPYDEEYEQLKERCFFSLYGTLDCDNFIERIKGNVNKNRRH